MPTLADIYSAIDSAKRRASDFLQNPGTSLEQMVNYANDRARDYNQQMYLAAQGTGAPARGMQPTPEQQAAQQGTMQTMGEAYNPVGMTVFHGSPYRFTQFDANKIGSGEGNQVYGHGLYFAEAPAVAEGYQKRLAGGADPYTYNWQGKQYEGGVGGDPIAHALGLSYHQSPKVARDIAKQGIEGVKAGEPWALEKGIDYFRQMYDTASQIKKKDIKATQGALYKVDLPDEKIAAMLDWDNPVPEAMREKLSKTMLERFGSGATGTSGEKLYKEIQKNYEWAGSKNPALEASNFLQEHGIPGVRYLDAGSRRKGGTSNFVVFDPSHVNILERNGMPIK